MTQNSKTQRLEGDDAAVYMSVRLTYNCVQSRRTVIKVGRAYQR